MLCSPATASRRPAPGRARLLTALLLPLLAGACSHTVTVRSDPPGARIRVDGRDLGPAPVRFVETPGSEPHQLRAELPGHAPVAQTLERSELGWMPLAGLGLASAGLAGGLCALGALLANPAGLAGLCGGCLVVSVNADLGCTTMCAGLNLLMLAPGGWTAPAMTLGTLLGLSPLTGLWWLATSPDEVILTLPAAAPAGELLRWQGRPLCPTGCDRPLGKSMPAPGHDLAY